jgi:hypothetical protein
MQFSSGLLRIIIRTMLIITSFVIGITVSVVGVIAVLMPYGANVQGREQHGRALAPNNHFSKTEENL